MKDTDLIKCRFVSDLFEYASKVKECSSLVFIKAFVYSTVSIRISNDSFLFETFDINYAYEAIKEEKKLVRGKEIYPTYVMSWIGYIMEYFTLSTNIPLSAYYKEVKPEELYMLYESYHSLDNDLVIKRLLEAHNLMNNLNDVELMKKYIVMNKSVKMLSVL